MATHFEFLWMRYSDLRSGLKVGDEPVNILKMNLASLSIAGLIAMSACGQQYGLQDNPIQSALIDGSNHIEGDLDPRDPVVPDSPPVPKPPAAASPSESPPPKVCDDRKNKDHSDDSDKDDEKDHDEDSDDTLACGKDGKKMLVCHVPQGNVAAAHTICISVNGAMHGHGVLPSGQGGHGGDHAGRCSNGR
jgi:hypothetical protein